MCESDWVSVHAFYHGNLDHLLVHTVGPLVEELSGTNQVSRSFFLRYWEGGNHLRLRLLPNNGYRSAVERHTRARIETYLARFPAVSRLDEKAYARAARTLADLEGLRTYAGQLFPNNSVMFTPYRREEARFGTGASISAVERHFHESSRIALRVLSTDPSNEHRMTVGFATILLSWFCGEPDPGRLSTWLADGTGDAVARTAPKITRHEQAYTLSRKMHTLSALESLPATAGAPVEWLRSIRTLHKALVPEIADGRLRPAHVGWAGPGPVPAEDARARTLPVLDVCAHLLCNRLGLSPAAEFIARLVAVDAINDLAGERT